MAELRELSVKLPIKFSEKAQRDLYETCMGYKELAELRGAENEKLRELCADFVRQMRLAGCFDCFGGNCEKWGECHGDCVLENRARELGIEVDE